MFFALFLYNESVMISSLTYSILFTLTFNVKFTLNINSVVLKYVPYLSVTTSYVVTT